MGYKYRSKKSNAGISTVLRISEQAIQEMIGQLLAVGKPKAVAIHIPLLSTSTRYYDLALFPHALKWRNLMRCESQGYVHAYSDTKSCAECFNQPISAFLSHAN
jgi:hypothetical protein